MKKNFIVTVLILFVAAIMLAFISPNNRLAGKWTVYNSDGTSIGEYVEFKNDQTYNVYLPNGDIGETGYYKFKHHVFSIRNVKDYVCGKGYWGKYRLDFHGDDSIHFTLIEDSCANRRYDIVGVNPGLRRVKTK